MTLALHGISLSPDIAIGTAHVLDQTLPEIAEYHLTDDAVAQELDRLQSAINFAKKELQTTREQIPEDITSDIVEFVDAHILMLEDKAISHVPAKLISQQLINAEWAVKQQRDTLIHLFESIEDPYLRTRRDDVDHVINIVLRHLISGSKKNTVFKQGKKFIIIAQALSPSEVILFGKQGMCGFVTEHGGPMSHTAILARAMQIPAITGIPRVHHYIKDGDNLIIDGSQAALLAVSDEPINKPILDYFKRLKSDKQKHIQKLQQSIGSSQTVSLDNIPIKLLANIDSTEEMAMLHSVGACGVGLYRTESLYMEQSSLPTEIEQFNHYCSLLNELHGKPLTIRTLDIGADKPLKSIVESDSTNPALGLRAVRLSLKYKDIFKQQLRAILRASAIGKIQLMIPMLSNCSEIDQVISIIDQCKHELKEENLAFDPELEVGGMIETPAAAVMTDMLASKLKFLSIGTNDLIQYTLAIDRTDEEVAYLYDSLHPAILRLLHSIIQTGEFHSTPVTMCGEMAGDLRYTKLLLGLGLREFSMQPAHILEVKEIILNSNIKAISQQIDFALSANSKEQFQKELRGILN